LIIFVDSKWNEKKKNKNKNKNKFLPLQLRPFPEYPLLQVHVKLPWVFVQVAFAWHPPLLVKHSLISIFLDLLIHLLGKKTKKILPVQFKFNPFPKYPVLQEQVKLPFVFKQFAFISQLWVPNKHSSTSILIFCLFIHLDI